MSVPVSSTSLSASSPSQSSTPLPSSSTDKGTQNQVVKGKVDTQALDICLSIALVIIDIIIIIHLSFTYLK
jgi:hypothetical protein